MITIAANSFAPTILSGGFRSGAARPTRQRGPVRTGDTAPAIRVQTMQNQAVAWCPIGDVGSARKRV